MCDLHRASWGEKPLQLTDYGVNDDPTWSPDGREIAFNRLDEKIGKKSIYVLRALGGLEWRLYTLSFTGWTHCNKMSWSPDEKSLIVTEALNDGARARLDVLSVSDLTTRPLTAPANQQFDCDPTFSERTERVVRDASQKFWLILDGRGLPSA